VSRPSCPLNPAILTGTQSERAAPSGLHLLRARPPGHRADAEVTTVRDLSLVVLHGGQRPDYPHQRVAGGEVPDDAGTPLHLLCRRWSERSPPWTARLPALGNNPGRQCMCPRPRECARVSSINLGASVDLRHPSGPTIRTKRPSPAGRRQQPREWRCPLSEDPAGRSRREDSRVIGRSSGGWKDASCPQVPSEGTTGVWGDLIVREPSLRRGGGRGRRGANRLVVDLPGHLVQMAYVPSAHLVINVVVATGDSKFGSNGANIQRAGLTRQSAKRR
jgi:hypothetical protein